VKIVGAGAGAGAGAEIFDKLEPEPHKNGQAPQHFCEILLVCTLNMSPLESTSYSNSIERGIGKLVVLFSCLFITSISIHGVLLGEGMHSQRTTGFTGTNNIQIVNATTNHEENQAYGNDINRLSN
jgi:hypothetical protein